MLAVAAVMLCSSVLVSCQKSNKELIDELGTIAKETKEAVQNGNLAEAASLAAKGKEISEELFDRDLTFEEKAQLVQVMSELL